MSFCVVVVVVLLRHVSRFEHHKHADATVSTFPRQGNLRLVNPAP